jgi:predicted molibdopterin-dependent oxidoreductase YjgC
VADPARLKTPLVRDGAELEPAEWERALDNASAALSGFCSRNGASALGAVVSPHLTNEEHFQFGALLKSLGAGKTAMAVVRGKQDDLLIKAEKAANARGARELGLVAGADDGVEALLAAVEAGEIKGLYLCGSDLLEVVPAERLQEILQKLELLIFQGLVLPGILASAQVVFPTTTFAEKAGTFTNHAGRVQRIMPALSLPDGWLADGDIFTRLLNALSAGAANFTLEGVWNQMRRAVPAFGALKLGEIGPQGVPLLAAGK